LKTSLDCLPCFLGQTLEVARSFTPDMAIHARIARKILCFAAAMILRPGRAS
jgi:uncharacterized protein with ATP-grasp and redox domains